MSNNPAHSLHPLHAAAVTLAVELRTTAYTRLDATVIALIEAAHGPAADVHFWARPASVAAAAAWLGITICRDKRGRATNKPDFLVDARTAIAARMTAMLAELERCRQADECVRRTRALVTREGTRVDADPRWAEIAATAPAWASSPEHRVVERDSGGYDAWGQHMAEKWDR